jgi:2-amino-4-hydroxy-6-hydroxymethyldihydropteridine diphosphokinase
MHSKTSQFQYRVTAVETSAILGLGGNLGDPKQNILDAIQSLGEEPEIRVLKVSSFYASHALTLNGVDQTKPDYINVVVQISSTLEPLKLLEKCHLIEQGLGRVRLRQWDSRTLDIDIITYGDQSIQTDELVIPHPRAFERAFVLVPWAEIEKDAYLSNHGKVKDLAQALADQVWVIQ